MNLTAVVLVPDAANLAPVAAHAVELVPDAVPVPDSVMPCSWGIVRPDLDPSEGSALYSCCLSVSQWLSCSVPVLSVRLDRMPPLPHTADPCDLDEERKKELIMEKKLRACRVNIISRVSESDLTSRVMR